ncbi:MAG: sulfotransferase [Bacteroidales bacterium]|nr:sulfotransferase [Bacteroidales bacterium]
MTYQLTRSAGIVSSPHWFRLLNRCWKATYPAGTKVRLDKDDLIRSARRVTGLQDLGRDFWDEPLDRLLHSLNHEAALHPVGRFIWRQRLINLLSTRLRAEYWFRKHPGILEEPLYPVWMIIGLQRTGTTLLHRLLTSDPENRVLLSWEALNPVPLNGVLGDTADRIRIARRSEKALKLIAPNFFAIHPVEYLAPEEDILLLDVSFLSTTPEATTTVPSYATWLEQTDQSMAYAYAAKLMKLLQYQRPGTRWVLKSPHHLEFSDLAVTHFGDVHFLWTHRDVHQSIPSFLSMVTHSQSIFSDRVDPACVADHWIRKTGYILSKGLDFRLGISQGNRFHDIFYEDFIADPVHHIEDLYQQNTLPTRHLVPEFEKARDLNPRGKYGFHSYSVNDFGVTDQDIDDHTMAYQTFQKKLYLKSKEEEL